MTTSLRQYLELVRFSHTLFALPFALAAMLLAQVGFPPLKVVGLILVAMVTARNSAMAFNRLVDAHLDAKNPRTASRHLPQKEVTASSVIFFIVFNSVLFAVTTYFLNPLAFLLSPVALAILFFYSFTKRWTAWSHFFLGVSLALSPVGAWIAVRGEWDLTPCLLALALLFWVSGFDIIYSTLDIEFDRREGLFSFPARYGLPASLTAACLLHAAMLGVLVFFGFFEGMNAIYFFGIAAIAGVILWEHFVARRLDPVSINRAFFGANAVVSLLFLAVIAVEILVPPF